MVAINPDLESSLEREAQLRGTTAACILSRLVEQWLEDAEDLRLAEESLAEGGVNRRWEDVKQELDAHFVVGE